MLHNYSFVPSLAACNQLAFLCSHLLQLNIPLICPHSLDGGLSFLVSYAWIWFSCLIVQGSVVLFNYTLVCESGFGRLLHESAGFFCGCCLEHDESQRRAWCGLQTSAASMYLLRGCSCCYSLPTLKTSRNYLRLCLWGPTSILQQFGNCLSCSTLASRSCSLACPGHRSPESCCWINIRLLERLSEQDTFLSEWFSPVWRMLYY